MARSHNCSIAGGKSDPYIIFLSDPPQLLANGCANKLEGYRSKTKTRTLTPRWEPNEVPSLPLCTSSINDLRKCHLLLVVYDKDRCALPLGIPS
jgi:hypothetical protein